MGGPHRTRKGGPLAQEIVIEKPRYGLSWFRISFGRLQLKACTKGEHVLRFEATVHNAKELRCRRSLENFAEIITRLAGMADRFATTLDCADIGFLPDGVLDELPLPARTGTTRIAGTDLNKPRIETPAWDLTVFKVHFGLLTLGGFFWSLQRLPFRRFVVMRLGRPALSREVRVAFWDGVRAGLSREEAAAAAGAGRETARRWVVAAGGVKGNGPVAGSGRFLARWEREEIAVGLAQKLPFRQIAAGLAPGRNASTVCREVRRNSVEGVYRAHLAEREALERARRPKPAKLAVNAELREWVQQKLMEDWSPEQISARLVAGFPGRPEMRVSAETIYQSLYVQGRGALRRELAAHLRTGRDVRRPRRASGRRGRMEGMVSISERPAEADDRAVPGHWEGDLIDGRAGKSHIGTLVERTTRYTMLVPLPDGKSAAAFAAAVTPVIAGLPASLRRSLTWDQGREMSLHRQIAVAADCAIYFCDPHSPWQRPGNENTNGLLRQYFPKGSDLSAHPPRRLAEVADRLNGRPRKVLGWKTPAEAMAELLDSQAA